MSELRRQIGIRTAAALVVGEVIAVGIFLTPAGMAKALSSPMWMLIVWVGMGAMALCGALCYGELAARYPEAGGGYVYLREAYGPAVAFMYGWMAFLVMDPGLTAALAVGLATYAGYGLKLSPWGIKALAIATIVVIALINIRGVRLGAGFVRVLTFLKLGLLAFVFLWGVGFSSATGPTSARSLLVERILFRFLKPSREQLSSLFSLLQAGGTWENWRAK